MKTKFEKYLEIPLRNGVNRPSRVRGKGYKMVNMGELFANDRIFDIPMDLVPLNESEKEKYSLKNGDLLFARQSIIAEGAGKCSIVLDTSNQIICFESHIIRARLNSSIADPLFFYYFFQSSLGKAHLSSIRQQGVQAGIRGSDLKNLNLEIPPLPTQRKIARLLSAYDELIENNLRRIQLLEEMAQQTYTEWFVRMKFPGHEHTPVDAETGLPEGWKRVKLGEVAKLNYGKALKSSDRVPGDYPVYGSSGVVGQHNAFIVKGPGVIVGRKGNVGSVFWEPDDFYPIDTVYYLTSDFSLIYFFYFLSMIEFVNNDAAVPGLNRNAAYSVKVKIPPTDLAKRFENKAASYFSAISNLKKQNDLLREARDLLLPRLMTGLVDVEELVESKSPTT